MATLREIAKKIPALHFVRRALRNHQLKSKSIEDIFTKICRSNAWGGEESVSGAGSGARQTSIIIRDLPTVFNDFNISTMLDIPCGDFHWMKSVDLSSHNIAYTGADIVKELIHKNREKYAREGVQFQCLNLIEDRLPKADLVFCRDCLTHFSFKDIFDALRNICDSQSEYLLTTTFTDRTENRDILTGQWRVLNLQVAPFLLPAPLKIINEEYSERNGIYRDKSLALWRIEDIRESLTRRGL